MREPKIEDLGGTANIDIPMPEVTEETTLRPCPKCRDEFPKTVANVGPNKKRWYVKCTVKSCGAHLKYCCLTAEEAETNWNAIKRRW